MAYGFLVNNSSGYTIIDSTWPNPQAVETAGPSTVARGTVYPSAGIANQDVVVARPIRNGTESETKVGIMNDNGFLTWGFNVSSTLPYPNNFAFYRLREGVATSTADYGLAVYEADGTTPIFNSNGVEKHFEIAAVFPPVDANNPPSISWFNIPSGDDINDYFCVLNGLRSFYIPLGSEFGGDIIIFQEYLYDYANNRIAPIFGYSAPYNGGSGIIGKIL